MDMVSVMSALNLKAKKSQKIVIVDDYEDYCKLISEILEPSYECFYSLEANSAMRLIADIKPDLIILDYRLPGVTGIDICRSLRQSSLTKNTPIVFVSGTATVDEKIQAFESGADDFISKPFNSKEFFLRVKARLSKTKLAVSELYAANLRMNLSSRQVFVDNEEVSLTRKQFDILRLLVEAQNNLVTRTRCLEEIWGDSEVTARNVDSQINYLKQKINKFNGRIVAVTSLGYRLEVNTSL